MLLSNDFFRLQSSLHANETIEARIQLNAAHQIFEGHFPGQPVVPGVCMVQMIKEILEIALDKTLWLQSADYIKFLSVIDPRRAADIDASIRYTYSEQGYEVGASLFKEGTVYLKLKANFKISEDL